MHFHTAGPGTREASGVQTPVQRFGGRRLGSQLPGPFFFPAWSPAGTTVPVYSAGLHAIVSVTRSQDIGEDVNRTTYRREGPMGMSISGLRFHVDSEIVTPAPEAILPQPARDIRSREDALTYDSDRGGGWKAGTP
jgi:hypothetical protein